MGDDELWHVRISEDEVKTLTLEQIDDLYRLDVIDADTQLWQDGMDEWLPLRVVAGLDEPEVVNISMPPTMPPPKPVNTLSSWPPVAGPVAAQSSSRPPVAASRPAPPSSRPAAPSSLPPPSLTRPPIPSSRPAAASSLPPPSLTRPPIPSSRPASTQPAAFAATFPSSTPSSGTPFALSPSYAPPASGSVRPQMVSPVPYAYPKPTNFMPIVLAAVAGLVITLYRNDMLIAGARTVGQEATYLKLESALGGPGFGTPRAVEPMAKAAAALLPIAPLPLPVSRPKYDASSSSNSSDSSSATTAKAAVTSPAPLQPEARPIAKSAPDRSSASRSAPTRPVAAEAPDPVFKQPKGAKKAKGNEFDPLNGNL
jgi:hypothetical protein